MRILWWRKPKVQVRTTPPSIYDELQAYLYWHMANTPIELRQPRSSRWVMSQEWLDEVRRTPDAQGFPAWQPPVSGLAYLLGIPVDVREDAGVPHLEAYVRP